MTLGNDRYATPQHVPIAAPALPSDAGRQPTGPAPLTAPHHFSFLQQLRDHRRHARLSSLLHGHDPDDVRKSVDWQLEDHNA